MNAAEKKSAGRCMYENKQRSRQSREAAEKALK